MKRLSVNKTAECMAFLREKSEEILEKLRNGETEISYPIGGESYTEKEWDKLLKKFDDIQEDVRRKMEERFRKMEEKEEKKKEPEEKVVEKEVVKSGPTLEQELKKAFGMKSETSIGGSRIENLGKYFLDIFKKICFSQQCGFQFHITPQ